MSDDAYPVSRVFATGRSVRDLVAGIPGDESGEISWVLVDADPVFDDTGEIAQVIVTFMDITERKRNEQEVARQKEMLETTLASLTHPFFVLNVEDYRIVMANSASIPLEGLPAELTCYALTHRSATPCDSARHPCPLEQVKASKAPAKVEHIHYALDGSPRYVEVYGYPIFDEAGNVVQMIEYTLDITERKKAQKSLAERTAALARSNAELEEFAYIASHDLQEPLRKVQAFGDRLQVKYGEVLEARGRDYLTRMQNAATRMRQLIDDLLTYSRVTTKARPFEAVDLNAVVEDVIADLVVRIEETGGHVEVRDLPTIDADPIQMRRLFQNLIGNALKFHRNGVPPIVKIYAEGPEVEGAPVLGDASADGLCRIFIEDNGIGFDMAYVAQVFAPFQRLHGRSAYEGTGMGLAICRKIVARHGGEITVESEPDAGATFIITVPIKQSKEKNGYDM
jgi:signal transduction histidine kinase